MTVDYSCLQIDTEGQLNNLGKLIGLFHHKGNSECSANMNILSIVVENYFIILLALFYFFIFK